MNKLKDLISEDDYKPSKDLESYVKKLNSFQHEFAPILEDREHIDSFIDKIKPDKGDNMNIDEIYYTTSFNPERLNDFIGRQKSSESLRKSKFRKIVPKSIPKISHKGMLYFTKFRHDTQKGNIAISKRAQIADKR